MGFYMCTFLPGASSSKDSFVTAEDVCLRFMTETDDL